VLNLATIAGLLIMLNTNAQPITTVYCLPGQGSDKRIFDQLTLPPSYRIEVIEYGTPGEHQSMASFAKELSKQIDISHPYIFLGHSLGGMLCVELAEILQPQKTIIISSAKNWNELPYRYKVQRAIGLYPYVPGSVMLASAKILQPWVERDRNKFPELFTSMLAGKDAIYMKHTIAMILTWERLSNSRHIYHIHGTKDHTIPIDAVKSPDYVIEGGSHMMVLTRGQEVSEIINRILSQ